MNEEEQVELLSRVDIFESLSKEEIREILVISSSETRRSTSEKEKSSTLPGNQTASSSSSRKARVRIYKMEAQESSPSKW